MNRFVDLRFWQIYYATDKDMEEDYELKAFVDEMVDIAKALWLKDYYTTSDKKGLMAKVR